MEKLSMNINKYRLQDKNLYLVADFDQFENDDAFLNAVAGSLKGGIRLLQLREKNASAVRIIELGKKIRSLCSMYGALFVMNDRVDIAKIVEADGVHLGQEDVDIESAKEILGSSAIIGISTHSPEQAIKAQTDGADYISVGPVFASPTKLARQTVGIDYAAWASKNIEIPFYAIGGIDLNNVQEVLDSGVTRVAVFRAIINNENPEQAARLMLDKLK